MTLTSSRCVALGMVVSAAAAGALDAQQDSTTALPAIVVTANRNPTPRELVTARVTVLRGADLRAQGITQVAEALRGVPGLNVVQGGSFGSNTSVFMRGGESDYVRVLVDGVPVNDPGGSFDFAHLTVENIERIEVVRGPSSVIYGSDAVSGVIQIFTASGSGAPAMAAGIRGGTFGTYHVDGRIAGGGERASYAFGVGRMRSDGAYAFNNAYRNTTASGRFRYTPDERSDVSFVLRYTDATFHFPTDGTGALVDSNQFTASEMTTLGLSAGRLLTDRVEGRVALSLNDVGTLFDDQQDGPADTVGFFAFRSQTELRRRGADGRVNVYVTPTTVLTAGIELEQEWQRTDRDRTRGNRAYYAQVVAGPFSGFTGNAGVRLDDNERFGSYVTARAGAAYRVGSSGTRLSTSIGTAFKEPTFLETFDGAFSVGNPELQPEESLSWEIGLEQPLLAGRAVVATSYFDQRFENLIQFAFSPPNPGDPNYFNVAEASARGVEVEVRASPVEGFLLTGNYTYLETDVTNAGFDAGPDAAFVEGDRLLRRPTHAMAAHVSYRLRDRATASAGMRHTGSRDDRDFSTFPARRRALGSYTVVDVSVDIDVIRSRGSRPGFGLALRVENLLDEAYREIVGFPARGRTVLVGGRIGY